MGRGCMHNRTVLSCQSELVHYQMSPSLKSHVSAGCGFPSSITALLWQHKAVSGLPMRSSCLLLSLCLLSGSEQSMCVHPDHSNGPQPDHGVCRLCQQS